MTNHDLLAALQESVDRARGTKRSVRGDAPTKPPADEPPPPSPDPRGDGLCPNCPTDLATLDSGHGVCIECGWTSDPGKCMELYNRIDELENELHNLRAAPADDVRPGHPAAGLGPSGMTDPICGDEHDDGARTWTCTRYPKHRGQHVAAGLFVVEAVWPAAPADDTAAPDGLRRALADITAARDAAERSGDGHVREGLDEALDIVSGLLAARGESAAAPDRVTTDEVYRWHLGRFGEPDVLMVSGKLAEETGEVCGAIVKRAEGAVRPAKGLVTREDWTRHLHDEIGDAGIVLNVLAGREGTTLDDLVRRRFRDDVALRTGQEAPVSGEEPTT